MLKPCTNGAFGAPCGTHPATTICFPCSFPSVISFLKEVRINNNLQVVSELVT